MVPPDWSEPHPEITSPASSKAHIIIRDEDNIKGPFVWCSFTGRIITGSTLVVAGAESFCSLNECNYIRHILHRHRGLQPFRHERAVGADQRADRAPKDCALLAVNCLERQAAGAFVGDDAKQSLAVFQHDCIA